MSVLCGDYAQLAAVGIDDTHFLIPDLLIDKQFFVANGKAPPKSINRGLQGGKAAG